MNGITLTKTRINGYDVLSVHSSTWKVCTKDDRLGTFGSREEAFAYAASLPTYTPRPKQASA
ncbi:DUF2188 domain-containing protein [Pseudomonas sp. NA-150]|uniref:DUF2188 domain-containing protein n=1 Tax=Pseudomonas sp. NA-150 TaxID=3367525 RepID=UPI0037C8B15E